MEISNAAEILSALGNESRLTILRLLAETGSKGINAGVLSSRLNMTPATLSSHLSHLARVGLIRKQKIGRLVHYSRDYGKIAKLIAFLTNNCSQGNATCLSPITSNPPEKHKS